MVGKAETAILLVVGETSPLLPSNINECSWYTAAVIPEARHEGLSILSNRFGSSGALCRWTYIWLSPEQSGVGSGRGSWLNAVCSLRRARFQPDLLGLL